jgi:hypothetical protein
MIKRIKNFLGDALFPRPQLTEIEDKNMKDGKSFFTESLFNGSKEPDRRRDCGSKKHLFERQMFYLES